MSAAESTGIGGELPTGLPPGLREATNPFAPAVDTAAQLSAILATGPITPAVVPGVATPTKLLLQPSGMESPPRQMLTRREIDRLYLVWVPADGPPTCQMFTDWDTLVRRLQESVGQPGYAFVMRGERLRVDGGDAPALHTPWGQVSLRASPSPEIPDGWLGKSNSPDLAAPPEIAAEPLAVDPDSLQEAVVFPTG